MKRTTSKPATSSRKKDHVLLTVRRDVAFREKRNGFGDWEFVHNALPELNLSEISTETVFLSKRLSFPFMISCMTGGYADAKRINKNLAEVCEERGIAMGVGSQRQALEDTTYHSSFSIARKAAPSIPIVGNIGAAEVAKLKDARPVQKLADLVQADAFAVHLNPLQEFLQPEGSPNFRGVLKGIEMLVRGLSIPVIVKEIGAGISQDVAQRLVNVGVRIIDVAGAGGTSWAGVEILRRKNGQEEDIFWDWGIPTAEALRQVVPLKTETPTLTVIGSGGIMNGLDAAKAIAMGADLTASARPMLQALMNSGTEGLKNYIDRWVKEFKGTMFLVGAQRVKDLQKTLLNRIRM
ncbi:MAG TPA: type 2 isopentenyl-diphosphate Delta-isomerase [Bacteroidota bacterium]|nr:type 2 isopentenyl-diphosphate Delta-isomerase [Bacteroidota bacterium]